MTQRTALFRTSLADDILSRVARAALRDILKPKTALVSPGWGRHLVRGARLMVSVDHFGQELRAQMTRAAAQGAPDILIDSDRLCRALRGGLTSTDACCKAMQVELKPGIRLSSYHRGEGGCWDDGQVSCRAQAGSSTRPSLDLRSTFASPRSIVRWQARPDFAP
jgi:hypothetical protein